MTTADPLGLTGEIVVPVDLDVLLPALREAAGAELRGATSLTLRESGFSVRRDEHRPLLVVTRDVARRLRVRCWPGVSSWWRDPRFGLMAAFGGAGSVFLGVVSGSPLAAFIAAGPLVWGGLGLMFAPGLWRFREHTHDDVAWLAAVLDRATKRLPPPEVGDDYR